MVRDVGEVQMLSPLDSGGSGARFLRMVRERGGMTPEGRISSHVKTVAKEQGLRFVRVSFRPGVEVGWPDSIIMGPNRGLLWVETKALGRPLRPIQANRKEEIEAMGHEYSKIDNRNDVSAVLVAFAARCAARGA